MAEVFLTWSVVLTGVNVAVAVTELVGEEVELEDCVAVSEELPVLDELDVDVLEPVRLGVFVCEEEGVPVRVGVDVLLEVRVGVVVMLLVLLNVAVALLVLLEVAVMLEVPVVVRVLVGLPHILSSPDNLISSTSDSLRARLKKATC